MAEPRTFMQELRAHLLQMEPSWQAGLDTFEFLRVVADGIEYRLVCLVDPPKPGPAGIVVFSFAKGDETPPVTFAGTVEECSTKVIAWIKGR